MTTALLVLGLFCVGQEPAGDRAILAQVRAQAQAFALAFQKDDYAKLAELMHPKWSAKIGSRSRIDHDWRKKANAYRNQGYRLESSDVETPAAIVKTGAVWMCVVPTKLNFQAIDGKGSLQSYLLAMSPNQGKNWHFVDGADTNAIALAKTWVPNWPAKLELPEVGKVEVEKADEKRTVFTSIPANFRVSYPDRWEVGQPLNKVTMLALERGDDSFLVLVEEHRTSLEALVQLFARIGGPGKQRRLFGHKDLTVAGAKARFFRFDESTDQELRQYHCCVFIHQGLSYRVVGIRRVGEVKEFEVDYLSMLERFAFVKDRPAWVKQNEGVPTPTVLLGGLASFEVDQPRWTEDTFDNLNDTLSLDSASFRFLPGEGWLRATIFEAHGDLTAELEDMVATIAPRFLDVTKKSVTFTTAKGKWPGWELQGTYANVPRTIWLTATINDGISAWLIYESHRSLAEELRPDWENLLDSFRLQAQTKPARPLAFPIRRYTPNQYKDDAKIAAILKKATLVYPGLRADELLTFSADGKLALLNANGIFLEDLGTKKKDPLPIKGPAPFIITVSPDRKWFAYRQNDDVTVYPLGFGFSRKVRAKVTSLAFGPGPGVSELLAVVGDSFITNDYRDGAQIDPFSLSRLVRVPLDGSPHQPLFDWPLIRVGAFAPSPDGKRLAVVTNRDFPRTQQFGGYLYVCKADGSDLRLVNKEPADYRNLGWSPDGKSIYALRRVSAGTTVGLGGQYDVYRISIDAGAAENLTRSGKVASMWVAGADLLLKYRDHQLPVSQQGIFRISVAELIKATAAFPAPKVHSSADLAEKLAARLITDVLGKTPVRQFVPTTASMQRLAETFADVIQQEAGIALDHSPESLDQLAGLIDQLDLRTGKHPVNVLGVGAYYGETIRKAVGAQWHIKPLPFGEWLPSGNRAGNSVTEIVYPFSEPYRWAMYDGNLINAALLRTRARGQDWLLVYPPSHADEVIKVHAKDYLTARERMDQGEVQLALDLLAAEMKKRPANAPLARELIALCKAMNRGDLAKAYTKRAVEAGSEAHDLLVQYADDLMSKEPGKAIEYYRRAAQVPYAAPTTLIKLGQAYQQTAQRPLAESCWRRAYFPASDLQRNDIRRLMGLREQALLDTDVLDKGALRNP